MVENQVPSKQDAGVQRTCDHTVMYRPVGPAELEKLAAADFRAWPPRLPEQPIFYPVTNERYATQIARDWNVPDSGCGFVTRFKVANEFADRYAVQKVGTRDHTEWWIPAEDVAELNSNLIGRIEIIGVHGSPGEYSRFIEQAAASLDKACLPCPFQKYQCNMKWSQSAGELPFVRTNQPLECQVRTQNPDGTTDDFLISLIAPTNSLLSSSNQLTLIPFGPLPKEFAKAGTKLSVHVGRSTLLGEVTIIEALTEF